MRRLIAGVWNLASAPVAAHNRDNSVTYMRRAKRSEEIR